MDTIARLLAGWPAPLRLAVLVLAVLLAVAPGLGPLPALDRDEAQAVQVSRQMVATGRLLDPRFQLESRAATPPALHWVQALAARVAGGADAPLAAFRAPGALGAALAVALTAWAALPLLGARGAVLAGLMLGGAGLTLVEARIGRADAVTLALVVLAQGLLLRVWDDTTPRRWRAGGLWAATGLGVLAGGPMAALPLVGAAAAMGLSERRLPWRSLWLPGGLAIVAVLLLPWALALWLAPDRAGIGTPLRAVVTLVTGGSAGPVAPPGTYLSLFFVAFWPLAVLAPFALLWLWGARRTRLAAFVLGWAVPVWLVFEAVPAKLPHHMLLACPAVAILLAAAFDAVAARTPDRFARVLLLAAFALPALALVAAVGLPVAVLEGRITAGPILAALAAAVPLTLAAQALWRWRLDRFTGLGALGAVLGLGGLLHLTLPALPSAFIAPRMAEAVAAWRCGATGPVAVAGTDAPSVVLALGADTLLTGAAGAGVLLRDNRAALAFVPDDEMAAFAGVTGPMATALTRIEGFDLASLRGVELALYAMDREAPQPCAP